jgi:hypothetical protein
MQFSQEDQEFYDLENLAVLPTSIDEITNSLLWYWFSYFKMNEDYEEYCEARRSCNLIACKRLEDAFPNIAELFDDWKDIHTLPIMGSENSVEWKTWLAANHHLFFAKRPAINLVDDTNRKCESNHMQVSIPRGFSHKQLRKLFDQFLTDLYPNSPESASAAAEPRYKLDCQIGGRKLKSIQKTFLVGTLMEEDDYYTREKVAEMVFENPPMYVAGHFEWVPIARQKLQDGKDLRNDPADNKRSIDRMHKTHLRYIAGTIKGIFPIEPE